MSGLGTDFAVRGKLEEFQEMLERDGRTLKEKRGWGGKIPNVLPRFAPGAIDEQAVEEICDI
jgi:hypothetical protein